MMSDKTILIVRDAVVVDARLYPADAQVSSDGSSLMWGGESHESHEAAEGETFVDQSGAGVGWLLQDGELVAPLEPPPTADALLAYVALRCAYIEGNGFAWNGKTVLTDPASQQRLATERLAVVTGDREDGEDWVFAEGPAPLSNEDVSTIATSVRSWVRDLLAKREAIKTEIQAEPPSVTTREQIDEAFAAS